MQLIFQYFFSKFKVSKNFFKFMICLGSLLRIYEKKSNPKKFKNKKFFWLLDLPQEQKSNVFWGITPKPKIGIL
jgi:hypothetical protein